VFPGDVIVCYNTGGGGYGDPLERDPASVQEDVVEGKISENAALDIYGVVINSANELDLSRTRLQREKLIQQRLQEGTVSSVAQGRGARRWKEELRGSHEYLELDERSGKIRCRKCKQIYCDKSDDPIEFAIQRFRPLSAAGPWLAKRWNGNSPNFFLVESLCPSCGTLFDASETLKPDLTSG